MVLSPASPNAPPLTKEWFFFYYTPLPITVPNFPLVAHEVSILFLSAHSLQAPKLLYEARAIIFLSRSTSNRRLVLLLALPHEFR